MDVTALLKDCKQVARHFPDWGANVTFCLETSLALHGLDVGTLEALQLEAPANECPVKLPIRTEIYEPRMDIEVVSVDGLRVVSLRQSIRDLLEVGTIDEREAAIITQESVAQGLLGWEDAENFGLPFSPSDTARGSASGNEPRVP